MLCYFQLGLLLLKNDYRFIKSHLQKILLELFAIIILLAIIQESFRMINEKVVSQNFFTSLFSIIFIIFALNKIFFSKYPPIFFSIPGIYYIITGPFNVKLIIAIKLLLNYIPVLILVFILFPFLGLNHLVIVNSVVLALSLIFLTNISWINYNLKIRFKKILCQFIAFSLVIIFFPIKGSILFWVFASLVSFLLSIMIVEQIQWPKFMEHCRFAYLSKKYFFEGNWAGLLTLMYEQKKNTADNKWGKKLYWLGWKSLVFKELIIYSRLSFSLWLMLFAQMAFAVYLMKSGGQSSFFIGGIIIVFGFTTTFANPSYQTIQKQKKGFMIPLSSKEFLLGMLLIPLIISIISLTVIIFILNPPNILIRIILVNFVLGILSSLLTVTRSFSNMRVVSLRYTIGLIIFIGYFFSALHFSPLYLFLISFPAFLYNYILIKGAKRDYEKI